LNSPHAIYLKTLFDAEPEGITAAQLGEICGKDKADVSRMVAILENRGLVRKVAVGKNMYRAKLVLTEAGREAAEHVRSRAAVAVELAGSGLSEEERENFYKALALITENLRKLSKNGLPQG
jgi:DNA-binding MarR family transcriptional regulator